MKTERISKRHLTAAWKTLSSKPMPKVKALRLSDDDFNNVLQHRQCIEDDFREIEEWGRILSTHGTDACVLNGDETRRCRLYYSHKERILITAWMKSLFMSYRISPGDL